MARIYLGPRIIVHSFKTYKHKNRRKKMVVRMDGKTFDSADYLTMRKFLQALINYTHLEVQK